MDAIAGLQHWLEPLLEKLEPQAKRNLMREIAQQMRVRFKDRIAQQRDPDGVKFVPRKNSSTLSKNPQVRFLYRTRGGKERIVSLKSYNSDGKYYKGFDLIANDIRTFKISRIVKHLSTSTNAGSSKRSQIGSIKSKIMFSKIGRDLKTVYTTNQAEIGFSGRTAQIAKEHQEGQTIRPTQYAKPTKYSVRKLIGFGKDDEEWAMKVIEEYLSF